MLYAMGFVDFIRAGTSPPGFFPQTPFHDSYRKRRRLPFSALVRDDYPSTWANFQATDNAPATDSGSAALWVLYSKWRADITACGLLMRGP